MARVVFVAGLGYGDEGKGSICDFLTRNEGSNLTVRYSGGAQCGHNAVTEDGRHHTFSQFGSGTFAGARTFLSRFMIINPITFGYEAKHLESLGVADPLSLVTVEEGALVTSPFHMAANRLREALRDHTRHGSCGMGIGETVAHHLSHPDEAVHVSDLAHPDVCHRKLVGLRKRLIEEMSAFLRHKHNPHFATEWEMLLDGEFVDEVVQKYEDFSKRLEIVGAAWLPRFLATKNDAVIFEGAQGVLLDQDYGWAPHNTWSDCTFANAENLVGSTPIHAKIGVIRGYMTRHGAGPMVTENPCLPVPRGEHNTSGPWQHNFRVGHFDQLAIRYALEVVGGVDYLALTCLDHLGRDLPIRSCTNYTSERSRGSWQTIPLHLVDPTDDALHSKQQHRQEEMGKILGFMKPVYETLPDVDAFIAHVEQQTKTPVRLCSFGPKASDKRAR